MLDWELTMKCNLDCSYCLKGTYGGHDNSTLHPDFDQCLKTIDFMFEYVDKIMTKKVNGIKHVVLNIYGGESLHHPRIVEILQQVKQKYLLYKQNWHLVVKTTTNAIVSKKKLLQIVELVDEFTVSYHTEHTEKQRQQFKENLIAIRDAGKRVKCVVLMHHNQELFDDAQFHISWLEQNNIPYLPRQLDNAHHNENTYKLQQIKWFNKLYQSQSTAEFVPIDEKNNTILSSVGRGCCGGRSFCSDQQYSQKHFYVQNNRFENWYCSVDEFFLYVKQLTGEVFVNRDCKMNYQGEVGPIGLLSDTDTIIKNIGQNPVIQCKKEQCWCGLCAPKAQSIEVFDSIMTKYRKKP